MVSTSLPICRRVSWTVRFCAFLIQCLILEKACSIGLVRRIGRQEPEPRTGGVDQLTDGCGLVAAEIVQDDDVAWLEHRHQLLLDIGAEALAVQYNPIRKGRLRTALGCPLSPRSQQYCD